MNTRAKLKEHLARQTHLNFWHCPKREGRLMPRFIDGFVPLNKVSQMFKISKPTLHSCLKWPLEEIYNLIFEHLTYSAILVPNWNT